MTQISVNEDEAMGTDNPLLLVSVLIKRTLQQRHALQAATLEDEGRGQGNPTSLSHPSLSSDLHLRQLKKARDM